MTKGDTFNILLVDDEENIITAFSRLLHRLHPAPPKTSYKVLPALDGSEAMEILKGQPVDCVLLDYRMPGVDGLELLKKILEFKKDLAVIMITGEGSEDIAVEAMKNGAMDYLIKGNTIIEDLERAIINATDKTELHKKLEEQRQELANAERQRVMIETLGAACHHLGQPATVIKTYISIMKRQEKAPEKLGMINEFEVAIEKITDILDKLRKVSKYRTVPYLSLTNEEENSERCDKRILDIEIV